MRTNARSFAGGEVTPEFFGRIDDTKYQTGLAKCLNFIVKPHGPATNRGGLRFIAKAKSNATASRLLPFVFAPDQSVVIEMGAGYFRFFSMGGVLLSGGSPYEISHPYTAADLAGVKFVQSNDILTLVHPNYPPAELRRLGAISWTYTVISFVSQLTAPSSVSATATPAVTSPGTPTLQSYVVTAVNGSDEGPSSAQDPGGPVAPTPQPSGGPGINSISKANPGVFSIYDPGGTIAVGNSVFISGVGGMTQVNDLFFTVASVTVVTGFDPSIGSYYAASTVTLTGLNTTTYSTYTGGGTMSKSTGGAISTTGVGACSNNLFDDGAYNTIAWSAVPTAQRYNVYKLSNGLFGYIGQTSGLSFRDDNIAAEISKTPPVQDNPFTGAGNYPAAVGYFEQRRCFAGTNNDPAFFWATRSGTESSLSYSLPQRDDDSIRFRIAARERCAIRHVVSLGQLILLSESSEWRVSPAEGEVLTPNVSLRKQSAIGVANAQPIEVNNNLVFAAARGGHMREFAYNWQANGYVNGDLCLRSPHLFDEAAIVEMAYAKSPVPIVWAVSSTGKLLGLTYVPDQQIGAWHQHDTLDGNFESICVVPEGENDVLYTLVRRTTISGDQRYVERMEPRQSEDDDITGFFVDSGLTYNGAPVSTVSGLSHLEGRTVSILADGGVLPPRTVTAGAVTLDAPASIVHVGLAITADCETLPLAFEVDGYGQGRTKNVSEVWLRVYKSRGIFAGPSFSRLTEHKPRTTEGYDRPPATITGEIRLPIAPSWNTTGAICLRHSDPLPFTLVSMTLLFDVGG